MRRYTCPPDSERCIAHAKTAAGNEGGQCMRRRAPGSQLCSVHQRTGRQWPSDTKEGNMRYFAIIDGGTTVAMADEQALGRVVAQQLLQYVPGSAQVVVKEVTNEQFQAFKRAPGTARV